LFETKEEYPDNLAERGVPQGTSYDFVSSTFLDGFINYVKIFAAFILDPPYGGLGEYKEDIEQALNETHTKFRDFGLLEVILLAETENSFWLFWYDPDVSDCSISRCEKEVTRDEFRRLFLIGPLKDETYMELSKLPHGWVGWS